MARVLVFGTSPFAVKVFEALRADSRHVIVAVVTTPDRPSGRGLRLQQSPAAEWAAHEKIDVLRPAKLRDRGFNESFKALHAEVAVVAAYGKIIPEGVLNAMPGRVINVHPSLLPKYRGASPIQTAIMNGDRESGISFIYVTAQVDAGDILFQQSCPVDEAETCLTLESKLAKMAGDEVGNVIVRVVSGTVAPTPQDHDQATMTHRLDKEDGHCRFDEAGIEERRVRAYAGWPGAWAYLNGVRLKFLSAKAIAVDKRGLGPGTVIQLDDKQWAVACRTGLFVPNLIQFEGKRAQAASTALMREGLIGGVLT